MIRIKCLWENNKAQGIIEYALLLAFVVVVGLAIYLPIEHGTNSNGRPIYGTMLTDSIQIFSKAKSLLIQIN